MNHDLDIILYVLRRKRRLNLLIYIAILNFSLFGILVGAYNDGFPGDLIVFVSTVILTLCFFLVTKWFFSKNLMKHPLVQIFNDKKDQVVWVYWHRTENMPFGVKVYTFNRVFICFQDSSFYHISAQKDEVDMLMEVFQRTFKRAVFGYSKEREQLYNINPELISKD